MTVKEISNLTGLSTRTIQRKIKNMFPELSQNGINTDLTENQSIALVNECRVKVGTQIMPRQDVRQNVELIKSILEPILKQQNEFNMAILTKIESLKLNTQSQLPKQIEINKDPISELNQIIRKYSLENNKPFNITWGEFYTEFKYHYSVDITTRAANKGVKGVDIIREIKKENDALLLAKKLFQKY